MNTRRDFLKSMILLLAGGTSTQLEALAGCPAKGKHAKKPVSTKPIAKGDGGADVPFKISEWTGDDFRRGHQFRDGDLPKNFPEKAERQIDFVIVGGGMGGLSAAHYLRDHDFLLLEQYDELGGQSRGGSYKGIGYSMGAAYCDTIEGIYGQLYSDLGITPEKLPAGDNSFFWNKHWHQGLTAKTENDLYRSFKRLNEELAGTIKALPSEDTPQAMADPALAKLDSMRFGEMLKGYSPEFMALLDTVCRSAYCGSTQTLSAVSGTSLIEDLSSTNYVFKGGNPAIARALIKKLNAAGSGRLQSGCFVWKIQLNESGANVFYTSADGQPHNVACKHVIVATPPMVAWRQIANLDDKMRIALMPFKYGAYLVANFLMKKKLFDGAYDNWVAPPFSFSDMVVAETPYRLANEYKAGGPSVLTLYQPYEPSTGGRSLLLAGDRTEFADTLKKQLSQLVDHLDENLEEIVLTRWGHAMVVPMPNFYAKLQKILASYKGPYSLAYSSTQGPPCVESAIRAGKFAAERAMSTSVKVSVLTG